MEKQTSFEIQERIKILHHARRVQERLVNAESPEEELEILQDEIRKSWGKNG